MATVVTGLSQNGDVSALERALGEAGLSIDPISVIGPDDASQPLARGLIGGELMEGDLGAGVPGINYGHHRLQNFFRNEALDDRLGDLEIPESELDNYVEALERGRSLVAYFARPDTVEKITEIFRNANLMNVRAF